MKRTLNWWDLTWFSIGAVVGAGIFVITGEQAQSVAGPAILLSYVAAGFSSMLSVFIYTEFALEVPSAGGSFAFLRVELGDFVAFIAAGNVVMEYAVGTGAVARAWTSYFATLINKHPDELRIHTNLAPNFNMLDPIAVVVIWITGLIAAASTRGMSTVNWIASTVNMLLISFIIVAGLSNSTLSNYEPFLPFGVRGVFAASATVYFAYLGFDAVATLAEETKNPARDIPIGLVGSMVLVTTIYCLMALTLCLMQKYTAIDPNAPFSYAFRSIGWNWAQYLVALGALKGMTTVLLVGTVSQARYVTHIARTHMIPPWFSHINKRTGTPIRATIMPLVLTSVIALFTSLSVLSSLLSISTLTIFMLVAVALLVRRHYMPGETSRKQQGLLIFLILVIVGSSIGIAAYWALSDGWVAHVILGAIWFAATWSMWYFVPVVRTPKVWGAPMIPWLPAASIGTNIFLMGSIDRDSFWRFGAFTALIIVYYAFVGLHASYDAALELPVGSPEVAAAGEDLKGADVVPKADIKNSEADVSCGSFPKA